MYRVIFLYVRHMFCYMRFILSLCQYFAQAMFWMLHPCMCVDSEISWSLLSVVKHMRIMWLVICKKQYFLEYVYAYTLVSRWLPNTLCYNVCGISSQPVTAVAVYSQHSVPALIWHLLWTFLLLWQRTERSNIHWTSGMCCEILGLSYTHCQEYLDNNIYNRSVMENIIIAYVWT